MKRFRKKMLHAFLSVYPMLSCIMIIGVFVSCSTGESDVKVKNPREEIELSGGTRAAAEDLTDFYVNFTTDMANYAARSKESNGNVIMSPLSAAMIFAMTANGVEPADRKAFTDYLGTTDIENLNSLMAILLEKLPKADNTAEFYLANSVWVNKGQDISLTKGYASIVSSLYHGDIYNEDFNKNPSKVSDNINSWCRRYSGTLIPSHLDGIDSGTLAILINALYFKASWESEIFNEANTKKDLFYGSAGEKEVDMMESSFFSGNYAYDGEYEYYSMALGNEAYSMSIIVPDKDLTLEESCGRLTPEHMSSLRKSSKYICNLKLFLPKFAMANRLDLTGMLEATGRNGMCGDIDFLMFNPAHKGNVEYLQSASFSIDETGAKAAAVTSGEFLNMALVTDKSDEVIAKINSPFFFFIREFSTDACIFSGYISNIE